MLSFQVMFFCRSDILQVVPNNENGTLDVRGTVVGETILKVSLALTKNTDHKSFLSFFCRVILKIYTFSLL